MLKNEGELALPEVVACVNEVLAGDDSSSSTAARVSARRSVEIETLPVIAALKETPLFGAHTG